MKSISAFFLALLMPLAASASDCALFIDEGLAAILSQEGSVESVACGRNVIADLDVTVIFRCANGAESPLIAAVDRDQGDTWCGAEWIGCDGLGEVFRTPGLVSGKDASEDFGAIRDLCKNLL